MTEKLLKVISAFSNNSIISKVFGIFLCNEEQRKFDKFSFCRYIVSHTLDKSLFEELLFQEFLLCLSKYSYEEANI